MKINGEWLYLTDKPAEPGGPSFPLDPGCPLCPGSPWNYKDQCKQNRLNSLCCNVGHSNLLSSFFIPPYRILLNLFCLILIQSNWSPSNSIYNQNKPDSVERLLTFINTQHLACRTKPRDLDIDASLENNLPCFRLDRVVRVAPELLAHPEKITTK